MFATAAINPAKRKCLAKDTQAKQLLSFDQSTAFHKKSNSLMFGSGRAKSSADFLFDRTFDATQKANQEFYGAKAKQYKNTSKFRLEEMISPMADWANPEHQPARNSKNANLGVGVVKRGKRMSVNDSHMQSLNNYEGNGVLNQMSQFFDEMDQSNHGGKIYPNAEWTSNAARSVPNNV